jgi:hypothetical protein
MSVPDPLSAVRAVLTDLIAALGDARARAVVESVRRGLDEPLRVAIAGRVKAGKSTLVNALLRQRVAPTDVGECTRYVTWYRFGTPERLEVVRRDGSSSTRALTPDGSLPAVLGEDPTQVERLDVWLSMDSLRELTFIDTPGLASATTAASAATSDLLQLDRASRQAVSQAHVLLLVMPIEPRRDDLAALELFDEQFRGLTNQALNSVAVLSRVDQAALAPTEVRARAEQLARRLADTHRLSLAAVIPVNGLLAESAGCGRLTEDDSAALAALAELSERDRHLLLLSADRFVDSADPAERRTRTRLLELLDLHGIELALQAIGDAGRGASALNRELLARSGIDALRHEVFDAFARTAAVHKAAWAASSIAHVTSSDPTDAAVLRDALERVELDPGLHVIRLLRAVQQVASGEVALSDDLTADLTAIALAVGLDGHDTDLAHPLESADVLRGARRWRAVANDTRVGSRVQGLAEIVVRSYESLL